MKKTMKISVAALNFLHRVLSETGVVSRSAVNKQRAAFKCIESALITNRDKLTEARKQYRVNKPIKDQQGNERDNWIIPEENKEDFEKAILDIENTIVEISFDIESHAVFNHAIDTLFERQAALKEKGESEGVTGETTMKLISEAMAALDGAVDA